MQPKDLPLDRLELALSLRGIRLESRGGLRYEAAGPTGRRFAVRPFRLRGIAWVPGMQVLDLCGRLQVDVRDVYEDALMPPTAEGETA